jgi:hypothetical protein
VHCTSVSPAANMPASTATHRLKDVTGDESSPLASIPTRPLRSGFARQVEYQRYRREISAVPP